MAARRSGNEGAGVPEGFNLSMALLDCLPVLFFSISAGILAYRLKSTLFGIGIFLVILAGAMKAGWKFVIALRKKDVPFLNRQMRVLMPAGFVLALAALIADRNHWSPAAVLRHMTAFPAVIFFLAGAAGLFTIVFFARHLDHRDAAANWKEQMVNGITQFCVMLGIIF